GAAVAPTLPGPPAHPARPARERLLPPQPAAALQPLPGRPDQAVPGPRRGGRARDLSRAGRAALRDPRGTDETAGRLDRHRGDGRDPVRAEPGGGAVRELALLRLS